MTGEDSPDFSSAFARVLEPLAHLLIAQGMTVAEATELLKRALLAAALEQAGRATTDSRISLMTGMHRKDVKRLRSEDPAPPKRQQINAAALLVAHWTSDPAYLDDNGSPKKLARKGDAQTSGFDDLVRAAKIDLPAATLIEKLAADGIVDVSPDKGDIVLLKSAYIAQPGSQGQITAFERNLTAHLYAAAENMTSPDDGRHYERALHVNGLSAASIERLKVTAKDEAERLLAQITSEALALQNEDQDDNSANGHFSLGAYLHSTSNRRDDQ